MEDNTSGADLEEAHFYHVLSEYLQLVDTHGWEYVENKVFEMWEAKLLKQCDCHCKEGS